MEKRFNLEDAHSVSLGNFVPSSSNSPTVLKTKL